MPDTLAVRVQQNSFVTGNVNHARLVLGGILGQVARVGCWKCLSAPRRAGLALFLLIRQNVSGGTWLDAAAFAFASFAVFRSR